MGLTSFQASMDPSDWLQGTMCEDGGIESSSSPSSTDMLGCSRAMMERRLRPPHGDQGLKCPRCESPNTKFCYYNNYSLTQPRYFCKTCRRYWTKGGTLRNIPVGGGCRKNKTRHSSSSSASKRPSSDNQNPATSPAPQIQLPHHQLSGFLDSKYHSLLDRHNNDYEGFLGSKFDALVGNGTSINGVDFGRGHAHGMMESAPHNFLSPFGVSSSSFEGNSSGVLDSSSYQRLMLPYEYYSHNVNSNAGLVDVKPSPKLLSLQWQNNNGGADVGNRESFGYNGGFNGFTSWGAGNVFNGYNTPSSTTNPLI